MKKNAFENLMLILASISFYSLFWQEKMGLNVLLFSGLIVVTLLSTKREIIYNRGVLVTATGTMITAVLIVWNNSLASKVIHLFSVFTFVGFVKQRELQFLGYGFLLSLASFFEVPKHLFQQIRSSGSSQPIRMAPVMRSFRLSLVPLIILILFYTIYNFSNPEFRSLSNNFWANVFSWFSWNISLPQVLFFTLGVFISGTLLLKNDFSFFKNLQKLDKEKLKRVKDDFPKLFRGMIALKGEFQSGLIMLYALNVLLFVVNILDIKNYWFDTKYDLPPIEMKAMVHEGTYLLIAALLLAMIVISYFFRKNLNFYPRNKNLKTIGYLWIAQNGILAITLFIKNYRYIEANGLAYKRIGVLVFLILVFAGLITMILKIKERKTFYYLLHRNAWITYFVFIICCFVNWDTFITKYNLAHQTKNEIDYAFLIDDVSDKNLYILLEYETRNLISEHRVKAISYALKNKQSKFQKKQKALSWLSWNYADHKNWTYLKQQ